jgi:hypothetical protein
MNLAGSCIPGQVVPGIEVARARFRRQCGTWEPLAAMLPAVVLTAVSASRENSKQLKLQGGEYQCVAGGRTAS